MILLVWGFERRSIFLSVDENARRWCEYKNKLYLKLFQSLFIKNMSIEQPNFTPQFEKKNEIKEAEKQRTYAEVQAEVSSFQKQFGEMQSEIRKTLELGQIPDDEYEKVQLRRKLVEEKYGQLIEEFTTSMQREAEINRTRYENDFLTTLPPERRKLIENQIREIYNSHPLWHGTGKSRYTSIGASKYEGIDHGKEITQVLRKILQEGIVPAYDPYAEQSIGTPKSTSLTKQRMLARAFSDVSLAKGDELKFTYGATLYWHSLLLLRQEKLEEILQGKPSTTKQTQLWINDTNNETIIMDGSDVIETLRKTRSTIKDNFPVIFGIDPIKIVTKDLKKIDISAETEIRSIEPIPVAAFTHIEVPWKNLEEVEALLKELNIDLPVIPIEEGERWMSYHKVQ